MGGFFMSGVIPMLDYEDGPAAMDWLAKAFGFREVTRMIGDDGLLAHGEMETGAGLVMLATATPDYESPKTLRKHYEKARLWSSVPWVIDGVMVYVEDVEAHCDRARRAGATILTEPENGYPGKRYRVEDIEGHRWMFIEHDRTYANEKENEKMNDELQNEFDKLGRDWSQAIVSNDAKAIGSFMADDWVIVGETGITKREDFLTLVESGDLTHEAMEGDVKRVQVYGDTAVVNVRGTNNGHWKGQPFDSDEWITDVFVKRDGRWLCVLTHLTTAVDRK